MAVLLHHTSTASESHRNNLLVGFALSDFHMGQERGRPLRVHASTTARTEVKPSALQCNYDSNQLWVTEYAEPIALNVDGRASQQQGPVKFGSGYGPAVSRGNVRHGRGRPGTTRQPPTRQPAVQPRRRRQTPLEVDIADGTSPIAALKVSGGHCSGSAQQCGWAVAYSLHGDGSVGGPAKIVFVGEGVTGFALINQLGREYAAVQRCRYAGCLGDVCAYVCVLPCVCVRGLLGFVLRPCCFTPVAHARCLRAASKRRTTAASSSMGSRTSKSAVVTWTGKVRSTLSWTLDCRATI